MNTRIIFEVMQKVPAGTITFPEVVKELLGVGVEYYHVDYIGMKTTFYDGMGGTATTPINFENMPAVAADFSPTQLKQNILDSQRNGQHFRDFTRRAMESGVQGYFAFLRGQRVTYIGRQGDFHTEWFPGAQPAADKK